jgi:hypothetical protein
MTLADKAKLQGSFGSLLDTLNHRFDSLQPEEVVAAWTSAMVRGAACARNVQAWDAPIEAIDNATRALVTADYSDAARVRNALQLTCSGFDQLEVLLAI